MCNSAADLQEDLGIFFRFIKVNEFSDNFGNKRNVLALFHSFWVAFWIFVC